MLRPSLSLAGRCAFRPGINMKSYMQSEPQRESPWAKIIPKIGQDGLLKQLLLMIFSEKRTSLSLQRCKSRKMADLASSPASISLICLQLLHLAERLENEVIPLLTWTTRCQLLKVKHNHFDDLVWVVRNCWHLAVQFKIRGIQVMNSIKFWNFTGNEINIIAKNKTWHLKSQLGTPNEPWIWPPNLRDGMDGMASSSPSFPPGKARPPLVASVHRKLRRCPAEKDETEEREKTNMCIKNHKEQERKTWIT